MAAAEDDLRATLKAAYDEHVSEDSAEPDKTDTTETPEPADERPRDERGRFASTGSKADSAQSEPAPAEAPAPAEKPEAATASVPEAAPTIEPAPTAWANDAKAKWNDIPAEARKYIADREAQIHREFSKRDLEREFGRELQRVIQPYEAMIRAEGSDAVRAVSSLLNTAYILRAGSPEVKTQALRGLAQTFGIDIGAAAQQQGEVPQYVTGLQQQVAQLQAQLAQQQQAAQQQQEAQLQSHIEAFKADPKHQHFDKVTDVMAALLQSGAARDLDQAYSMAVWAREDLRATLTAPQVAEAQQRTQVKTQEAKRKAAVNVRGGAGGSPAAGKENRSLREELQAAFAETRDRV